MELKYQGTNIGEEKIKKYKRISLMNLIMFLLITIIYIILAFNTKELMAVIVFSVIFICIAFLIRFIRDRQLSIFMQETLTQEICIDGFIELNAYFAKKFAKNIKKPKFNKAYNYSLLNMLDGYLRIGDFNKVNNIIEKLEKSNLDNISKTVLLKAITTISYYKKNKEEFNDNYTKFKESLELLSKRQRKILEKSLDIQKYLLDNNLSEANKLCDQLLNSKVLLNRVVASYYKGQILEKNNNEDYKKYYKFVVENGNNLLIAKEISKKINMQLVIKYNGKKHIAFKILTVILFLVILFTTIFLGDFYIEDSRVKKWDSGILAINNIEIKLPCKIEELEQKLNVKIDRKQIDELGYYNLYLNKNVIDIGKNKIVKNDKCIKLKINGDRVEGLSVDISNNWKDELDTELGNMVIFPENVTVNSTIESIKETYKTGIINPAMREWHEDIENYNTNEIKKSYGINYSGNQFNMDIKSINNRVISISYYCE